MFSKIFLVIPATLLVTAMPQVASAAPLWGNGGVSEAQRLSPIDNVHYYGYGGYGRGYYGGGYGGYYGGYGRGYYGGYGRGYYGGGYGGYGRGYYGGGYGGYGRGYYGRGYY
ncbi:MAG: hypothetical protein ABWY35_03730 [Pseudorhodoplanes sp.]